jgi:hypothetical protein
MKVPVCASPHSPVLLHSAHAEPSLVTHEWIGEALNSSRARTRGTTAENPREAEYECRRRANAGEVLDPLRVHVRRRRMTIGGASAAGDMTNTEICWVRDDGRDRIRYGHGKDEEFLDTTQTLHMAPGFPLRL